MATPIGNLTEYVASLNIEGANDIINGITQSFSYNYTFFGVSVSPGWQAFVNVIFIVILIVANILAGNKLVSVIGQVGKKIRKVKDNVGMRLTEMKGEKSAEDAVVNSLSEQNDDNCDKSEGDK